MSTLLTPGESRSVVDRFPWMAAYADVLGPMSEASVIGEGDNAVIVEHPQDSALVLKLRKPGGDDLGREAAAHTRAEAALARAICAQPALARVRIPHLVAGPEQTGGVLILERITGHACRVQCLMDRLGPRLDSVDRDLLDGSSDDGVRRILSHRLGLDDATLRHVIGDYASDYLGVLLYDPKNPMEPTPLNQVLAVLAAAGVGHGDLHPGNVMTSEDDAIWLIDFGRTKYQ